MITLSPNGVIYYSVENIFVPLVLNHQSYANLGACGDGSTDDKGCIGDIWSHLYD